MAKTLAEISTTELEQLVERTIDKRLEVWLAQLADALTGVSEDEMPLRSDFAVSLRRSLEQARVGEGINP